MLLLDRALDVAEENDWERAVCASQQKIASQGLLLGVEQACCGQDRAAHMCGLAYRADSVACGASWWVLCNALVLCDSEVLARQIGVTG